MLAARLMLRIFLVAFFAIGAACGGHDQSPSDGPSTAGDGDSALGDGDSHADGDLTPSDSDADGADESDSTPDADPPSRDFAAPGPQSVSATTDTFVVNACTLSFTSFDPATSLTNAVVVLGHGFSRDRANLADVARHIASYGVRVVTPNFCHSSFLDRDHVQNGIDARALAHRVANGAPIIYAGQSAGGLAAVVAAAGDADTIGVLGLDLTDADNDALEAAPSITAPVLGLVGEVASCNANGNGVGVVSAAADGTALRVVGAQHCDFEGPTDVLCTLGCGEASSERAELIRALSAAFVAWRTGIDPSGSDWTTPTGQKLGELEELGLVAWVD